MISEKKIKPYLVGNYGAKLGSRLRPYAEEALRWFHRVEPDSDLFDFTRIFPIIQRIAAHLSQQKGHALELSADNIIRSDQELKRILPELDELRRETFGRPDPPFDGPDMLYGAIISEYSLAQPKVVHFPLVDPDDRKERDLFVANDGEFAALLEPTARLDEETCFTQASLVTYVLLGIPPIARAVRVRAEMSFPRHTGDPIPMTRNVVANFPARYVDIRLYRPFTDRELLSLLKDSSRKMQPNRKRFSAKHLRLHQFIEAYGQPALAGRMQYWRDAFKEWHRRYPEDEIRQPKSLRMAWIRFQKLLERG